MGGSTVFETAAIAHWLALPYCNSQRAAAAGIEPAKGRLTGACLYQHRPHRNEVRVAGFEPAISSSPSLRDARLRYTLARSARADSNRRSRAPEARGFPGYPTHRNEKRPAGIEPALPPWQGSRLPLHHGRIESLVELSKIRAPGGTRTHVAALSATDGVATTRGVGNDATRPERENPCGCKGLVADRRQLSSDGTRAGAGIEPDPVSDATNRLPCSCAICDKCRAARALHFCRPERLELTFNDTDFQPGCRRLE